MAGSRLEKLGTVFTRMKDLMRAGVVKPEDKPIWYDVYAAFPPKRDPLYVQPMNKRYGKVAEVVPEVFYKEDVIRAKFYEVYGTGPKAFDLTKSNFVSTCQRFVEKYNELESQGTAEEEMLFEETGKALLAEGIVLRRRGGTMVETDNRDPVLEMRLKDMLSEQQADAPGEAQTPGQPHEETAKAPH